MTGKGTDRRCPSSDSLETTVERGRLAPSLTEGASRGLQQVARHQEGISNSLCCPISLGSPTVAWCRELWSFAWYSSDANCWFMLCSDPPSPSPHRRHLMGTPQALTGRNSKLCVWQHNHGSSRMATLRIPAHQIHAHTQPSEPFFFFFCPGTCGGPRCGLNHPP